MLDFLKSLFAALRRQWYRIFGSSEIIYRGVAVGIDLYMSDSVPTSLVNKILNHDKIDSLRRWKPEWFYRLREEGGDWQLTSDKFYCSIEEFPDEYFVYYRKKVMYLNSVSSRQVWVEVEK